MRNAIPLETLAQFVPQLPDHRISMYTPFDAYPSLTVDASSAQLVVAGSSP
jgi:hypothetical protein